MKFINFKNSKGFTIIEMLIYIAILVFMLLIVVNILLNITRAQKALKASKSIESSALFSMERITREIRNAQSVNIASSTFGTNPGLLALNGTDINGSAYSIQFYTSTSTLYINRNGAIVGPLTQTDSQVTNLVFTSIIGTSSRAVRTQMTIQSGTSTYFRTGNFYSTIILRGSL